MGKEVLSVTIESDFVHLFKAYAIMMCMSQAKAMETMIGFYVPLMEERIKPPGKIHDEIRAQLIAAARAAKETQAVPPAAPPPVAPPAPAKHPIRLVENKAHPEAPGSQPRHPKAADGESAG